MRYEFASSDPIAFISKYNGGAVLDEIQRVPALFSAIQVEVDRQRRNSLFVLSGSQNFLLLEKIGQSLAGRTAILHLLPLSVAELSKAGVSLSLEETLWSGGYPRIYDQGIPANDWLSSYIQTYLERDVRSLKNVSDLPTFQRFLKTCAARLGNIIDFTSIGNDLGLSHNTIRAWVGVLETSFIVYQPQPHFKNYNKRIIKSPKLYFYDTGLLCALLGIRHASELESHALRGAISETFVPSEIRKYYFHRGMACPAYFWRDLKAKVDCLLEPMVDRLLPIEVKSSQTLNPVQFRSLNYWMSLANANQAHLVYAGDQQQVRKQVTV